MNQMTQESKSLWRIKNVYAGEAQSDAEKTFWATLAAQKETTIAELKSFIKQSI